MHKGVCVGGPMAGLTISTRSDLGFVAVDKPASAAWLYKIDQENGRYVLCTLPDDSLLDEDGTRALDLDRLGGASAEGLDVVALPDAEPEADEVPAGADLFSGVLEEPVVVPGEAGEENG